MQNKNLYAEIANLENKWEEGKQYGEVTSDYQKLYHFNMLYAKICAKFHYLDKCRKAMKDRLYLEFRKNGDAKTDKMAEAMARTSVEHTQLCEEIYVVEEYFYQLRAKIAFLQGKMESEKSSQISENIEKRLSTQSGEGRY